MLIKICPLCDSEMKKAHYCDVCHSFVWKPQVLDIHYNTESRGRGEIDCAYGEVHDEHDHRIPSGMPWERQTEQKPQRRPAPRTAASGSQGEQKKPGIGRLVVTIITIIILIDMLASFFVSLF